MKKLFISAVSLSIVLLLSSLSCSKSAEYSSIAKKEFSVESFTKMDIGGPFNVYIRQGQSEQVYVEADEKVINYVHVDVNDGKLKIRTQDFDMSVKKLNVYITLVKVDYMKFTDAGNVETKGVLKLDNLKIDYSRTGNMSLNTECNEFEMDSRGTGNIELSGSSKKAVILQSGIGNFNASNLKTGILKVNVSGVGNTNVFASQEIYINVSGVGNFTYSGDAVIKEYKVSGTGNVSKD